MIFRSSCAVVVPAATAACVHGHALRALVQRRRCGGPRTAQKRAASSFAAMGANGILDQDDLYRNGVPGVRGVIDECEAHGDAGVSLSLQRRFDQHRHVNPFAFVKNDIRTVSESIREVIGSDHPVLERIAAYFFDVQGKRVRPSIVLLLSRALDARGELRADQARLSEITEMIHTASLLHDDVIDESETRRGVPSVHAMFGNKLAILGGDFLLARASVALARLRNPDVVEAMSTSIEHLVKGEVMQMKPSDRTNLLNNVDYYMTKSFYKTASLLSHSCKSAAILGNHSPRTQALAFDYGKYLGLAFQIVDDLLDYVGSEGVMGKPVHRDMLHGISTLPVLYAAEQFPELQDLIARKFKEAGDVEKALGLVERSNSIEKARELAILFGDRAVAVAEQLGESDARSALISLVEVVLNRDA